MRVVQLVMCRQYRGAEIFAAHLSRELVAKGVEVLYLSLYKSSGDQQFIPAGIDFKDLETEKSNKLSFKLIRNLSKALKEFNPDIVQANAGDTLKYAVLAKFFFRLKYKIVFRNASTVSRYVRSFTQKIFNSFLYRFVDKVISVSLGSMDDFLKTFSFMNGKVVVIPNSLVQSPHKKLESFNSSDFNLVHVAGFTFEKNHEGLLRIYQMVKKNIPNAKLWLVGGGPLKSSIIKRVEAMKLNDVIFVGAVTNPLDFIASASVLILPSVLEGLPGVILEAFYCKTPVVAFNVGGISEVLKSGETGWLVKPNDEDGFVQAILSVSISENNSVVIKNAYDLVLKEFDNQSITNRFLETYSNIFSASIIHENKSSPHY